jgi:AcrR family transcriptional regulator
MREAQVDAPAVSRIDAMESGTATTGADVARRRVPAAQRRQDLVEAAVHEFAHGGLHGTAVAQIARRVGVAQPYVFTLFPTKQALFLAAVERGFERVAQAFAEAAAAFDPATAEPDCDVLGAMGEAYFRLLDSDPDHLMLQHQAYAACGEAEIRERVRSLYAELVRRVQELSGAAPERLDDFFRHGMWCNVSAAMGLGTASPSDWLTEPASAG